MTIKDIEERSGLPRANIRYYETEGLLSPTRSPNGYRDYSEEDLATLMKVKLLRELGCSLEEISALQRNETALDHVLERRLAALEGEAVSLARAKDICAKLRADGATYATLDPQRYISKDAPTVIPWEPVPATPPRYPWRRFFARGLDLFLATMLVEFLFALLFNRSIQTWSGFGGQLVAGLLSLVVVVAVEPVLLHRWGTTPGKWVFRLRLVREDGATLDWADAFGRTLNVLLAGCGLTIPLVSFVTHILSFYRETKDIDQPWAVEGEVFEDAKPGKDFHVIRSIALYALTIVLAVGLLTCGELKAARLPYPHPATVSQFAANYNKIVHYHGGSFTPPLDDQGNYILEWQSDDGIYHVYDTYDLPAFTYETASDGTLTTVLLDVDQFSEYSIRYPGVEMAYALQSLEASNVLFLSSHSDLYRRCVDLQTGDQTGLKYLPDGRWHAYLDYRVSAGHFYSGVFSPDTDRTQHVVLTLRLRRIK